MATSGSINYSETRQQIINDSLYKINAFAAEETIPAEDVATANRQLNRMVKAWQGRGLNMWTRSTGYLFTQKNQFEYQLDSTSSDHFTETYFRTTLTIDTLSGATSLTVSDSSDFTVADNIGIVLDDNTTQWTTVSTIPNSTTITIASGLTDDASSGKSIFGYTTKLTRPYRIFDANRRDVSSLIETPMNNLSYARYFELTNKNQGGTPISFNYVHERDSALMRLYLVPNTADYIISFVYARVIQDFDSGNDNADFPQEWLEALTINLAIKMCPFYEKNSGDAYTNLVNEAKTELDAMTEVDNEQGSIQICPTRNGRING